jgi:hypothetical protein
MLKSDEVDRLLLELKGVTSGHFFSFLEGELSSDFRSGPDISEHREIFSSEKNVLFFKSRQELIERIFWAQANPQLAKVIAQNGHKLIIRNRNTWGDRAFFIIGKFFN